jgi:hypothetical protein
LQPEAGREANEVRYVEVDIGKWKCRAAIMNPDGAVVDEFTFPNDAEGTLDLDSRLTPEDRVVMGSTGSVWARAQPEEGPVERAFAVLKRVFDAGHVLVTTIARVQVKMAFACLCFNLPQLASLGSAT